MTKSSNFLLATALASLMGVALLPGAYAQDAPAAPVAPAVTQPDDHGGMRPGNGPRGHRGGGDIAGMICSADGATQLETRLDAVATKLALTTAQQPLFDAYRTAALTAQTSYAESCGTTKPATPTPGTAPDLVTVLKDRQAHQTAELAALNAVLPSLEALTNSLTDTQKADLAQLVGPHHGPDDRGPHGDDRGGDRGGRGDRHDDRGRDDGRGRNGRG